MTAVAFDPTRDKSYRSARLGRDVVDWLAWLELGGTAPTTLDSYERVLSRLCKLYPTLAIGDVTDAELLQLARRFKPAERRVRMAAVRSFFRWAKQTRRTTDNPCDYLPAIKRHPQPHIEIFTETEVEALLQLPIYDAAPMGVLIEAGLRKAEARTLLFRDCLPEFGKVLVRDGKGGRDRVVPMSTRLQQLLADLEILEGLNGDDLVFYATRSNETSSQRVRDPERLARGRIGEGTFHRWFVRCLDAAGVPHRLPGKKHGRGPHTARHTFATSWLKRGLSSDELAIVMGHASSRTTSDIYIHLKADDVARRMALIEAGEA